MLEASDESVNTRPPLRAAFLACCFASFILLFGCVEGPDHLPGMRATTATTKNSASQTGYLRVEIADERVTVQARDVAMEDLLQEIARQGGFAIVFDERIDQRVTIEFHELTLSEALDHILQDRSFILRTLPSSSVASSAGGDSSGAGSQTLWVFADEATHSSNTVSAIDRLQMDSMSVDAERRQIAVEALGTLEVDEVIVPLSLALTDAEVSVRLEAVSALADIGSDQAVAALAVALNDSDAAVRTEAADALGDVGGETAIDVLEQALTDPVNGVKEAAIAAFADIGGEQSAHALGVLLNDVDPALRGETVDALGEIGGATAITLLQQALTDEDDNIREAAADYLAELSGPEF